MRLYFRGKGASPSPCAPALPGELLGLLLESLLGLCALILRGESNSRSCRVRKEGSFRGMCIAAVAVQGLSWGKAAAAHSR